MTYGTKTGNWRCRRFRTPHVYRKHYSAGFRSNDTTFSIRAHRVHLYHSKSILLANGKNHLPRDMRKKNSEYDPDDRLYYRYSLMMSPPTSNTGQLTIGFRFRTMYWCQQISAPTGVATIFLFVVKIANKGIKCNADVIAFGFIHAKNFVKEHDCPSRFIAIFVPFW
jgi:hypothetical protein